MPSRLTDLPHLLLLNIFNRLPLWKILQLASLCNRLNNIKREVFLNQTQLRLLGGCRTTKSQLGDLKKQIHSLDGYQNEDEFNFDLILKFDNPQINRIYNRFIYDHLIEVSHDIHVRNLEQISDLVQMFPNVKRLTVACIDDCEHRLLGELLRNWPNLTHLCFVDFQCATRDSLYYDNSILEINNLHDLQVLALHYKEPTKNSSPNWPLKMLEPLLQNSTKLHTLYFPVGYCTRFVRNRIEFEDPFRHRLKTSLEIPFDRFERFGLTNYWPERNNATNEQFISRITRLEVTNGAETSHLVNWSALQYLSLKIDLEFNSLHHLFDSLTVLHNLREFHLINDSGVTFRMPLESRARQLPQLASVRRFEFSSITSPYDLYRFKWALPNVAKLHLKLVDSDELTACEDLESFCSIIEFEYDVLPESCVLDMKRAFCAYGKNIQDFFWVYYRNGRKDDGMAELVPLVERCTKMIAGMSRINFDLEEIEQLMSID